MLPGLVATDLDGTLLRADGTLSPRTVAAFRDIAAAGVPIVIVTARPPRYLHDIAIALQLSGIALCVNGAMEYSLGSREVVATQAIAAATAMRVASLLATASPGLAFAIETGDQLVYEPAYLRPANGDLRVAAASLAALWEHSPIVKLLAWSASSRSDEMLAVALSTLDSSVSVTHSGGRSLLEISAAGVSKATALAALCARLGVDASSVVAFGDMPNDLAMLQWAGTGYAVANAHPSLLAAGLSVTASNDDDGVAQVLERLLSGAFGVIGPGSASPPR